MLQRVVFGKVTNPENAKLRDYMIRIDDSVTCKTCGKRFDIPSQHSMVFLQAGDR